MFFWLYDNSSYHNIPGSIDDLIWSIITYMYMYKIYNFFSLLTILSTIFFPVFPIGDWLRNAQAQLLSNNDPHVWRLVSWAAPCDVVGERAWSGRVSVQATTIASLQAQNRMSLRACFARFTSTCPATIQTKTPQQATCIYTRGIEEAQPTGHDQSLLVGHTA